jgi:flagellar FliL protein
MTDAAEPEAPPARKRRLLVPLAGGVVAALALGGGGFYATWSGLLALPGGGKPSAAAMAVAGLPAIAFVPVEPILVTLPPGSRSRHLRFASQLEVAQGHESEVAGLMPRILDVLNGYLRAIDLRDLEDPAALVRLRAQMLRRVQIVTGEGRVRDLLVTEFVLN